MIFPSHVGDTCPPALPLSLAPPFIPPRSFRWPPSVPAWSLTPVSDRSPILALPSLRTTLRFFSGALFPAPLGVLVIELELITQLLSLSPSSYRVAWFFSPT